MKYLREAFLLAVGLWWMLTPHNAFISQSILFFSLGAYFSIHHVQPLQLFVDYKKSFIAFCLLFGVADIVLHTLFPVHINLQVHRLALILNIPALFLLADFYSARKKTLPLLTNAAFIVVSIHYPIIVVLRKICVSSFASAPDVIQIILYAGCVILATLLSLLFYVSLDKCAPRLKRILSGNR